LPAANARIEWFRRDFLRQRFRRVQRISYRPHGRCHDLEPGSTSLPETIALSDPPAWLRNLPFDPLEYIEHLDELPFDPNGEPDVQ
jgi:arylsulfatase